MLINIENLKEYIGKEIGAVYQWNGIGRSEMFEGHEVRSGILRDVSDEGIYLEFTGIKPIVDQFGEIRGHRIPFKKSDIGELCKVFGENGKILYDNNIQN